MFTITVTRWVQEAATNEHGPYLTGRDIISSVEVTACADRAELTRELDAHGVRPRDARADSGVMRETRYELRWEPTAEAADTAEDDHRAEMAAERHLEDRGYWEAQAQDAYEACNGVIGFREAWHLASPDTCPCCN